jgi:N-acetyl-anhydromuramyl-L-alanine amidase AmpD
MIPKYIIIHHSHTADSETASWPVIRKIHMDKGWVDIGYHYGIEDLRGSIEIIVGRFENEAGAHCLEYNTRSIGICCIGNFDEATPDPAMWERLIDLIRDLQRKYKIKTSNVLGHRETGAPKSCPGHNFSMVRLRGELDAG